MEAGSLPQVLLWTPLYRRQMPTQRECAARGAEASGTALRQNCSCKSCGISLREPGDYFLRLSTNKSLPGGINQHSSADCCVAASIYSS